jgi:hypothetical protein
VAELTSPKMRRQLAALARRVISEQSDPRCRAYARNRPAISRRLDLFVALAERLESQEPVGLRLTLDEAVAVALDSVE